MLAVAIAIDLKSGVQALRMFGWSTLESIMRFFQCSVAKVCLVVAAALIGFLGLSLTVMLQHHCSTSSPVQRLGEVRFYF